jgi:hypothetical protein
MPNPPFCSTLTKRAAARHSNKQMEIRLDPGDTAVEVSFESLKLMIADERIGPKTLVRDKFATDGAWRTADNVALFHRCSHKDYPHGEHLLAEERKEAARKEQSNRIGIALGAYIHGDLIETRYGLPRLDKLRARRGVIGVARLITCAAFQPEQIITAVFKADGVHIEIVTGRTSLWYSLPQRRCRYDSAGLWMEVRATTFCAADAMRMYRTIPLTDEESLDSWKQLVVLSRRAPSCSTMTLDGISYRHKMTIDDGVDVRWGNPRADLHPNQLALIQTYNSMVERAAINSRMIQFRRKADRVFKLLWHPWSSRLNS